MDVQSREQIKDKMIRLAAEHWNLEENEIEANFDPLVVLLFDAVAGEIESLGYRIKDIQSNLLNELAALMLPHSLLRAKPAACILSARPAEDTCLLKSETNFSTIAKTSRADEAIKEAELNFTPIGEVKLVKASLGHLRAGNRVYKYQDDGKKTVQHPDAATDSMIQQIHFTITGKAPIRTLAGLQLFFDLKGHSEANSFYFALKDASLSINNTGVLLQKGFFRNEQFETSIRDAFNNDTDYSRKLQREIAGVYSNQFFTIDERSEAIASPPNAPAILQDLPEKLTQEINGPNTVFCTLSLRRPFSIELIERLQIAINAFPVINRRMEHIFHKTEKWINIIPLQLHGTYLDIHTIENVNGMKYRLQHANYDSKVEEGQAIIRAARVSKNSSNDIRNALKSLLEAIRDESAYFSRTSNDFISSRLTDISKTLTRLEDQVQLSKDEKPTFRYVLLKSKSPGEQVQVSYWTTAPAEAGFVKANAGFKPVQHSLVEAGSCFSVTPAVGGMEILNDYAQKQMLVRQLSSKGKIVSVEDIKLLCFEIFGQKLRDVRVQKTMKVLAGTHSGISRFIEIALWFANDNYSEEEKVYLVKQLSYQLELNGSFVFPFEIRIKEE
ncbi:type VI secretion system baseplate subunit TssF [Niabella yanshanensis]|uniref:Type VI secretion system baseplate subunit TssF n=1 Tax=Niabella yanshanensis TaxID=577386 RepID=A0ABZ0W9S0_9BACT|nr:type VI secretion system baseplate subunit TssF [Niabella yanshanensis]WQD40040.1 type VI secretion system baseplate subunit TssF [Niabella yanshanensis]